MGTPRDGQALIRQMVNLATAPDPLVRSPHLFRAVTDWSSDGRLLHRPAGEHQVHPTHLGHPGAGQWHPVRLVDPGKLDTQGQLRRMANGLPIGHAETGRDEVSVKRFAGDAPSSWKVSANGGNCPRWPPAVRARTYLRTTARSWRWVSDPAGIKLRARPDERLFDVHARLCGCSDFVPSPRRAALLGQHVPQYGQSQPLVVVLNWAADLEPARAN